MPLPWRLNGHGCVSNHQPHDCLLNCLFRHRSKKTSKLRVTSLVRGIRRWPVNSPHIRPVTRKIIRFDDVIMSLTTVDAEVRRYYRYWCGVSNSSPHNCCGVGIRLWLSDICGTIQDDKTSVTKIDTALLWRHNDLDGVSSHQPHDCLLNPLFMCISKKTSKLRFIGLCAGNSPITGELSTQRAVTQKMFPFNDVIMAHSLF